MRPSPLIPPPRLFLITAALTTLGAPARAALAGPLLDDPGGGGGPPPPRRVELALGFEVRDLGDHDFALEPIDPRRRARALPDGEPDGEAIALSIQTTGELLPHLYAGVNASVGQALLRGRESQPGLYYTAGGVVGLVLEEGPILVRGELVGGFQGILAEVELAPGDDEWMEATQGMIEPRAAVELAVAPGWNLGARVGSDLLRDGDWLFGLFVDNRGRALDGFGIAEDSSAPP